jgi:hypothetical protein
MVTNTPPNGAGGIVYKFVPIPEPATLALAGLGLALMSGGRCRRLL